jgi:hypothetical protein
MSRSTTAYASATNRERVHALELFAGETTPVSVDFTAILGATPALSSATWEIDNPTVAVMSDAVIDGNTSQITLAAQSAGTATLRCIGGTDSGTKFVQMFALQVDAAPYFATDTAAGPTSLEATTVVVGGGGGGLGGGALDGGGA